MIFLIILLAWLTPIIVFGIYAWSNMESGDSLEDFLDEKDLELDFVFILIPVFNLFILLKLGLNLGLHYLLNLKKP